MESDETKLLYKLDKQINREGGIQEHSKQFVATQTEVNRISELLNPKNNPEEGILHMVRSIHEEQEERRKERRFFTRTLITVMITAAVTYMVTEFNKGNENTTLNTHNNSSINAANNMDSKKGVKVIQYNKSDKDAE